MNNKNVPEWAKREHKKAKKSTTYWTEGYKLKITELILKYMEQNDISEEEISNKVSFNWKEFLNFSQFNLVNLAEVSMELGIDWEFNIIEVDINE